MYRVTVSESAGCHRRVCSFVTVLYKRQALTPCVVCQRLEGCHAVGVVCVSGIVMSRVCSCCGSDACWASGLGSGGCSDGCVISLGGGAVGGCLTLGFSETWVSRCWCVVGDTLCVTRCMCLLGGCDLCGVRFVNPKPSSQCL